MSYVVPLRPEALPAWRALGAALDDVEYGVPCRDRPEIWAPDHPTDDAIAYAEAHCRRCPVLDLCGAYADAAREKNAVWGGTFRPAKVGRPAKIENRRSA